MSRSSGLFVVLAVLGGCGTMPAAIPTLVPAVTTMELAQSVCMVERMTATEFSNNVNIIRFGRSKGVTKTEVLMLTRDQCDVELPPGWRNVAACRSCWGLMVEAVYEE